MDCRDVEKFYNTPKRRYVNKHYSVGDKEPIMPAEWIWGYNQAFDEYDQHIKLKLDIDVLSSIIYHIMNEEGVLDFCEKDCNAIAKAIKKEILP